MSETSAANAAIADPVPHINDAPQTTVELLKGIYNVETNTWETHAQVRELNGEDEEALASITSKKSLSYAEYMSALLSRSVLKIGDIDVEGNSGLIDQLIIGDRDLLFIGTVKATYGRVRDLEVTCSNCDATNYVSLNLDDDFAVERPKNPLYIPIEVSLKDGSVVKLNYPTGADSLYVAKKAKTTAEQNTLMLSRCAVWDSNPPRDKEQWAKSLNLGDRGKLVKALSTDPPGPKMEEVNTQCANCGETLLIVMDWVSLLFG
jgi:hypothetical protein